MLNEFTSPAESGEDAPWHRHTETEFPRNFSGAFSAVPSSSIFCESKAHWKALAAIDGRSADEDGHRQLRQVVPHEVVARRVRAQKLRHGKAYCAYTSHFEQLLNQIEMTICNYMCMLRICL